MYAPPPLSPPSASPTTASTTPGNSPHPAAPPPPPPLLPPAPHPLPTAGHYLRSGRATTLRKLLAEFDSDGDGQLDPLDLRRLVVAVMPQASAAQIMYIRVGAGRGGWDHKQAAGRGRWAMGLARKEAGQRSTDAYTYW